TAGLTSGNADDGSSSFSAVTFPVWMKKRSDSGKPRENGRLAKLSIIDDANASRKMLVVFAGAGRTSITFKGHLGISIAVAVLANILSLASAFLPTTTLSHQSDCTSVYSPYIGDGRCDSLNNNEACGWDGGDCCPCT
ncbi:unnamed protein product, partial [Ascophyllum nodosum]